jgi:CheY-like chemotaxis protein
MSKKLRFIWIDDNPQREAESENIRARLGVSMKFVSVKNKNLIDELNAVLKLHEPDLIIIDHKLEDIKSGIFKTGSTAAAFLREKWPQCPIICVTAVDQSEVDSQQRSLYEEIYSITKISKYDDSVLSIAKAFKVLRKSRPKKITTLLNLIQAPREEHERLKAILPKELKEDFTNKSLYVNISHWIRKTLLMRPGFLYDSLWAATLIGIKEESFKRIEKQFSDARYEGIFLDQSERKWWKSKLLSILSEKVDVAGLPWEKGRKLPGIKKVDHSKCYASGEDYPETVAFIDETRNSKRAQMRLHQTIPHPSYEDLLFFEEIRMMKPAE